jgi:hypothetical protein
MQPLENTQNQLLVGIKISGAGHVTISMQLPRKHSESAFGGI